MSVADKCLPDSNAARSREHSLSGAPSMHTRTRFAITLLPGLLAGALLMSVFSSAYANNPTEADTAFLQKASQANAAEVKVSLAAQTRSKNAKVKAFADRMVKDHSAVGQKIEALAKQKNIDVKTEADAEHMVKIGSMEKLQGPAFDHAYASLMVDDHAAAVRLFEQAAAETTGDADVKQFATDSLPTLRDHAKLASELPR
jgi:putative membrane protein